MKKINLPGAARAAVVGVTALGVVAALTLTASTSASAARDSHTSRSTPITAARSLIPVTPTPAGRLIQVHRATSPVRGGHATLMPHALVRRATARVAAAKACLVQADLKNPAYVGTAVDWAHGLVDFVTRLPLCRGVSMRGSGAAYTFLLGATPQGSGHPNVPLWPQQRVAATAWQTLSPAAGHHRFHIPPVTNNCIQADAGLQANGWNGTWPPGLSGPGVPQPYEVAFYVGNNRGCLSAPAVHFVAKCKGDCDGHGSVTYSCANPNPYATVQCWIVVGGVKVSGLTVRPHATLSATVALTDGQQYRFAYRLGLGRWGNDAGVGGTYILNCPPVPHLVMAIDCPCLGALAGRFEDRNSTRYTHVLTFAIGSHVLASLVVAPGQTLDTATLRWAKGSELVATVQSQLGAVKVGKAHHLATVHIS